MICSPETKRGRELARYIRLRERRMGTKKQSDNKGKQITEVEKRKKMGQRDLETVF